MTPFFDSGATGRVHVGDVSLAFEWWPGPGPLVALHGLTSHRRAFAALADALRPEAGVLAFDLRGRGDSDKPTGPYGIEQHATDVLVALDALGLTAPLSLVGHSMGAWIVAAIAARDPERLRAAVLLDGGDFRSPPDADVDTITDLTVGPIVERLHRRWSSVDELCRFFEAMPLYRGRVDESARRYFAFDVDGEPGALRAKAVPTAVDVDWREIVAGTHRGNLEALSCPTLVVTAPGGLTGQDDPVITAEILGDMQRWIPHLHVVDLPGENHHTFVTTASGAARTAAAVRDFLQAVEGMR